MKTLFFPAIILISLAFGNNSIAQTELILSDRDLVERANQYVDGKDFRKAEACLYALIQRNAEPYRTDQRFKAEINRALKEVRKNKAGPGSSGKADDLGLLGYVKKALNEKDSEDQKKATTTVHVRASKARSGVYKDGKGVEYQINRAGNSVWWTTRDSKAQWPTILYGKISGNIIKGEWAFMPHLQNTMSGTIKLKILDSQRLQVQEVTGDTQNLLRISAGTVLTFTR